MKCIVYGVLRVILFNKYVYAEQLVRIWKWRLISKSLKSIVESYIRENLILLPSSERLFDGNSVENSYLLEQVQSPMENLQCKFEHRKECFRFKNIVNLCRTKDNTIKYRNRTTLIKLCLCDTREWIKFLVMSVEKYKFRVLDIDEVLDSYIDAEDFISTRTGLIDFLRNNILNSKEIKCILNNLETGEFIHNDDEDEAKFISQLPLDVSLYKSDRNRIRDYEQDRNRLLSKDGDQFPNRDTDRLLNKDTNNIKLHSNNNNNNIESLTKLIQKFSPEIEKSQKLQKLGLSEISAYVYIDAMSLITFMENNQFTEQAYQHLQFRLNQMLNSA